MAPAFVQRLWFPNPRHAPSAGPCAGLVAVGGDLSVARLLLAYQSGIFPWTVHPISWWSPDPRAVFDLNRFAPPRSLSKLIRRSIFQVTRDKAFRRVMEACAAPGPGRETTWITPEFIEAYTRLHQHGYAHSVECWLGHALAGGIYGVAIGGFFAGESMFHHADNASKVALASLIDHLRARGFTLFDTQILTPVTRQLGAVEIPREVYLEQLRTAVALPVRF